MAPFEMNDEQRRIFIDTAQLHETYRDAFLKSRAYRGGMHWKKAKGKEYLFRSLDRYGYGKSLGVRSKETEKIYRRFHENKKRLLARLKTLKERLEVQARFCKAARIARVPRIVTAILRLLEQHQLLGTNLEVVGTNALFAYEARAGVFLDRGLLATRDMDVLWDVRPRLRLFNIGPIDTEGLIDILQRADRSFEILARQGFSAANKDGYMVDLIRPEPGSISSIETRQMGEGGDLVAAEISNLQWLVSAPKFEQIVIGEDGFPATMVVPDPRAFAVHKLWLSRRSDRDPRKRKRDLSQASAVCKMVLQFMPELEFKKKDLRMFPETVTTDAVKALEERNLPPGYEQ